MFKEENFEEIPIEDNILGTNAGNNCVHLQQMSE